MTSLRGRLLVWLLGLFTAVGLLAGAIAYVLDGDEVDEALDAQLRHRFEYRRHFPFGFY